MSQFCALHDEHAIRTYLYQNPLRHIYELGDLDPFFCRTRVGMVGSKGKRYSSLRCSTYLAARRCC